MSSCRATNAKGRCLQCGARALKGRSYCQEHLVYRLGRYHDRYARRGAA